MTLPRVLLRRTFPLKLAAQRAVHTPGFPISPMSSPTTARHWRRRRYNSQDLPIITIEDAMSSKCWALLALFRVSSALVPPQLANPGSWRGCCGWLSSWLPCSALRRSTASMVRPLPVSPSSSFTRLDTGWPPWQRTCRRPGAFAAVDVFDAASGTPTGEQLAAYEALQAPPRVQQQL